MTGGVLLPDFEFRFFLEDAQNDRRMFWHLLLAEQREQLGRKFRRCVFRQLIAVFAKALHWRQSTGESRR